MTTKVAATTNNKPVRRQTIYFFLNFVSTDMFRELMDEDMTLDYFEFLRLAGVSWTKMVSKIAVTL